MRRGILPPILLPFRLGAQGRLVLLLNWYPYFLDQSYAPSNSLNAWQHVDVNVYVDGNMLLVVALV